MALENGLYKNIEKEIRIRKREKNKIRKLQRIE